MLDLILPDRQPKHGNQFDLVDKSNFGNPRRDTSIPTVIAGLAKTREAQLAGFTAYIRRQLSHLAVQQQSRLLLDRLKLLGDRAGQAARTRAWTVTLEQGAERERRAQAECQRQARPQVRSGFVLLD